MHTTDTWTTHPIFYRAARDAHPVGSPARATWEEVEIQGDVIEDWAGDGSRIVYVDAEQIGIIAEVVLTEITMLDRGVEGSIADRPGLLLADLPRISLPGKEQ